MTYEEAIKAIKIKEMKIECKADRYAEFLEGLILAREALEKQIPKKPIDLITDENEFICIICPSCQEIAVEITDKYCRKCGQAIDWSE